MRFLTADWVFPLYKEPIKNGVLCVSDEGRILDIIQKDKAPTNIETFKGILFPGFINAHCHLELSHLKNFIPKKSGFISFANKIKQRNIFSQEKVQQSIIDAEIEMKQNGIVAVGDICNTSDTIPQKQKKILEYYNFIEVFQIKEEYEDKEVQKALQLRIKFLKANLRAALTPHARYSVTPSLMEKIVICFNNGILSIHNQETEDENKLFNTNSGKMFDWLYSMGASNHIWEEKNRNNIIKLLSSIKSKKKLLLVHNTFTSNEEVSIIEKLHTNTYWCTCPKSNLFIEGKLPNYNFFQNHNLCIGTDSLASNNSLSMLDEIKIIASNSNLDLQQLLVAACYNGSKALGFDSLGSFHKNKKPGINLMKNLNGLILTRETEVEVIL